MIINHNIAAHNAHRHFSLNIRRMDKSLESLSSGERINRAQDDAAGLAVSEKMRAQIRGLNQASRNLQDASSLIQTTEGFLKESGDVLQRIRELAVQAANGTYTSEDRSQINVEVDELVKEINRIHEDAKFNTLRLLDGKTLGHNSFGIKDGSVPDPNMTSLTELDIRLARNVNFNDPVTQSGKNGLIVQSGANTDERMFMEIYSFNTYALGITDVPGGQGSEERYMDVTTNGYTSQNANYAWREKSFYALTPVDLDAIMYLESSIQAPVSGVTIDLMNPIAGNRLDVSSSERSTESIAVLDVALNKVNKQRADLGGFQNRIELAREGVDNAAENLQSAESRIRDADMAKSYVEFTKNQILSQSAASMTAQANLRAQIVLKIIG